MEYTINEQKVYINACQEVEYMAHLDILLTKENELLELVDLFLEGGNHREKVLISRREGIRDIFKPKIAEAKRQLKNCEKRLNYNVARC
jgi:uroporphyrinogen-III synthase